MVSEISRHDFDLLDGVVALQADKQPPDGRKIISSLTSFFEQFPLGRLGKGFRVIC